MLLSGYGDRYPNTSIGRYFCILYAIIGIPFTAYLVSVIGTHFVRLIKRSEGIILRFRNKKTSEIENQNKDKDGLNQYKFVRTVQSVMTVLLFLAFLWLLPSIIIMHTQDWSFEEAVYFCFITISTIGLGDVTPDMSVDPLELDEDKPGDSFRQVMCTLQKFLQ